MRASQIPDIGIKSLFMGASKSVEYAFSLFSFWALKKQSSNEAVIEDDLCMDDEPLPKASGFLANYEALLSESVLAKDWLTQEEEEAWQDL